MMNRIQRRTLTALLFIPALAIAIPSSTGSYSQEEKKEFDSLLNHLGKFSSASKSYKSTVNQIVKRAYEMRRQSLLSSYDRLIQLNESQERIRRIVAITLFEDFFRRYPNDKRWSPDVIFRLAELYFEKSNDEYLIATEKYEKELKAFEKHELSTAPTPPKQNYQQTIELHRQLIQDFPKYRLIDGAYYLLGFCLTEMTQEEKGKQAFLSLVCANQYKPPLLDNETPSTASPDAPLTPSVTPPIDEHLYDNCVPLIPKSRFISEGWTRVGEYHFDENQLGPAIAAYRKVVDLGVKDNPYFDEALYKLAWTYYRADKFTEAILHFDHLIKYADKEYEKTGKYGSEMRPEAIQYLGISFAEEDWDGDTVPDAENGLERIEKFYSGREKEKHVYEIYRRLAEIYFNTTKYAEAIKVYKLMLNRWPYAPDNPEIQDKIIIALERVRNFDDAIKEREVFSKLFGKGTTWEQQNLNNPTALKKAHDLDEQALIQAAVFHHKAGQELKQRGVAMADGALIQQAAQEYARAATSYERYLERFPDSKNTYELRYSYASCLFFSQRFLEAAKIFAEVRDSELDNRYQEEAAFSTTKSYEEYINGQIAANKLANPNPPSSEEGKKPTSLTLQDIPEPYKNWQIALDAYVKVLPNSPKTPRLVYKAAEIPFKFLHFSDARKRFNVIYDNYCKKGVADDGGQSIGLNAGQAILVTYELEDNLNEMEVWAQKLKEKKCGGTQGVTVAVGATKLLEGIRFKRANDLMAEKKWDEAAQKFLALVDANPTSSDADKALNNAAVCYEQSKRFESATKLYERLWQQYKESPLAGDALWRAAINYQRFFYFDKAVQNFLILADSPRFASSPNRTDAVYNAAVILENDQAYAKSAKLFLRYASTIGKPKEAAEAHFRAGMIYKKMDDFPSVVSTFRQYSQLYASVSELARYAVEAPFQIALTAQKRHDGITANRYFQLTIDEFKTRGLAPASDAAEFASHAAFQLAEKQLEEFLKTKINITQIAQLKSQEQKMAQKAIALKSQYDRIVAYKRARWTLAAMYRAGTIYEHFAKTLAAAYRNAPIPKKVRLLGQEAMDIYQSQLDQLLEQQVRPVEEKAQQLYEQCTVRAKEFGVSNEYTEEALARLNAIDPVKFPVLKPPKIIESLE